MQKVELKPCPFCGEKPYIKAVTTGHTSTAYTMRAELGCKKCNYSMKGENVFEVDVFMNVNMCSNGIGHMVNAWNRRA